MALKRKSSFSEVELPAKFSRIDEVLSRGNNSLMQLNEIGIKGLKWNMEQISNVFPQRFKATCVFGEPFSGFYEVIPSGTAFYCEGSSKSVCKHDIANQIMDLLSGKRRIGNMPVVPPSQSSIHKLTVEETLHISPPKEDPNNLPMDSAVRILNEKIRDITYNFVVNEEGYCCYVSFRGFLIKASGTSKKLAKRAVAAKILQKYFKMAFASEAGKSSDIPTKLPNNPTKPEISKTPPSRQKNFSDRIQSMVKYGYEKLVSSLDVQYSKRKVLAGIIISRKLRKVYPEYYYASGYNMPTKTPLVLDPLQFYAQTGWQLNPDDSGEILKLVTISSGTKCLSGSDINDQGLAINDCHAEIVSKRAFQYFIYQMIARLQDGAGPYKPVDPLYGCDIVESVSKEKHTAYRLKDDVKVHLYVSSAPCGDSRIFQTQSLNTSVVDEIFEEDQSIEDPAQEDTHPNRKNRGVLRTKIECGEGTIPIKVKHIQTWDGILGGERLLTMSCSDKVCTWNVLGIQGALLSNVLAHPIYLDSITIGSLFHQEHLERALYERALGVSDDQSWINSDSLFSPQDDIEQGELQIVTGNIDPFRVHKPYILTVSEQDDRCPGKASNFSVNWIIGDCDHIEIVSTSNGLTIDNSASRLCKNKLLRSFLKIFKDWLDVLNLRPDSDGFYRYNDLKSIPISPDGAVGSNLYQRKKIALFMFFVGQNFGRWIGKPTEQDWFGVKYEVINDLNCR